MIGMGNSIRHKRVKWTEMNDQTRSYAEGDLRGSLLGKWPKSVNLSHSRLLANVYAF